MKIAQSLMAGLVFTSLWSCTPSHESVLTGYLYQPAVELNRYPIEIVAIDGSSRLDNVYRVDPGMHTLTLASRQSLQKHLIAREESVQFNVEPCKRYYLAAQHESPILDRWHMVVDYVEDIPGCKYPPGAAARKSAITSDKE